MDTLNNIHQQEMRKKINEINEEKQELNQEINEIKCKLYEKEKKNYKIIIG